MSEEGQVTFNTINTYVVMVLEVKLPSLVFVCSIASKVPQSILQSLQFRPTTWSCRLVICQSDEL